jgi:hypothetical protein
MIMLFIIWIFFQPLNHALCVSFQFFWILINIPYLNPIKIDNYTILYPKVIISSNVGQRISCTSARLQHDVMNNASSHTCKIGQIPHENIIQHENIMLLCFMYRINMKKNCARVDFDNMNNIIEVSPIMLKCQVRLYLKP